MNCPKIRCCNVIVLGQMVWYVFPSPEFFPPFVFLWGCAFLKNSLWIFPSKETERLRLFPCASSLLHGPLDICLDLLPAAPPPPVQKRDAQLKFHEDVNGEKLTVTKNGGFLFLVPIFPRFTQSFSRFIRDINGERTSRYWCSFSRLVFHGLPPPESFYNTGGGGAKRRSFFFGAKPLPEDLGDEILHFYPHPPAWRTRWIFGGKFSFIISQGKMA